MISSGEEPINNSDNKIATLLDITIKMMDTFSIKAITIGNEIESARTSMKQQIPYGKPHLV
jgi:hypothetical protein